MSLECNQVEVINQIKVEQERNKLINAQILSNQELLTQHQSELVKKLETFFSRLEEILLSDVERRKDVEQIVKNQELLDYNIKELQHNFHVLEYSKSNIEGSEILKKVPIMWNWYQQEKGWRRFIPGMFTFTALVLTAISLLL